MKDHNQINPFQKEEGSILNNQLIFIEYTVLWREKNSKRPFQGLNLLTWLRSLNYV